MTNNCLFYGHIEKFLAQKVKYLLESIESPFYKWPAPFEQFKIDQKPHVEEIIKILCGGKVYLSNEVEDAEQLDIAIENRNTLFIVIENLHYFANSAEDPAAFYKQLLDACNFYSSQRSILFVLSDIKIPLPFIKANPLIEKWEFINCDDLADEYYNQIVTKENALLDILQEKKMAFTKYQLIKAVDFITQKKETEKPDNAILESDNLEFFLAGLSETEYLINSDIYFNALTKPLEIDLLYDYEELKRRLKDAVMGQEEAIQKFVDAAAISYSSVKEDNKPNAVFLFVGPSGVGKTEICRQLKDFLPGYRFLQINLSEYNDNAAVDKLIGIGRGYEGSKYGGILTEPIRRYPKYVILFDELDHAHSSVFQLFYKIFEGEIMDGRGRPVSFKDCFIIMTTNKGIIEENIPLSEKRFAIEKKLIEDKSGFSQPFLGRINSIIQFKALDTFDLLLIAKKYFKERIIGPYKTLNLKISLTVSGAYPGLLRERLFDEEILFYELFALMAIQNPEQGARRLFQVMDEGLIHPIELCRIRYHGKINEIRISFFPFWPDDINLDYDNAKIILIDDEDKALEDLKQVFKDNSNISIEINKFEPQALDLKDCSLLLLDLYQGQEMIGKDFLDQIKERCNDIPVCIYSALPSGPQYDRLKAIYWQYGISEYISKGETADDQYFKIKQIMQKSFTIRKSKSQFLVRSYELEHPISEDKSLNFTLKWK